MGEMKKWVGSNNKVLLLLVVIAIIGTTMADTSVAARNELSEQPSEASEKQQLMYRISNILLQGVRGRGSRVSTSDDYNNNNNLSCWAQDERCNVWDASKRCCDGYRCDARLAKCTWCPRRGDSCGLDDPCCPGFSCDGWFSGTCS